MYYIVGDVHGRYDLLKELIAKLPKDAKLIFVGDLIDRGMQSKEVVEFIRKNNYPCVRGNHEQFMIEQGLLDGKPPRYFGGEHYNLWISTNGGGEKTIQSYGLGQNYLEYEQIVLDQLSDNLKQFYDDIEWMKTLPHYIELDDYLINSRKVIVSHSCISPMWDQKDNGVATFEKYIRENRSDPEDIKNLFNVYGHQYKEAAEITVFSACIDTSQSGTLTAIEIPSLKTYTVKDKPKNIYLSYKEAMGDLFMTYDGEILDYQDNRLGRLNTEQLEKVIFLADALSHNDFFIDTYLNKDYSMITIYNDDKPLFIKCHDCKIANNQYKELIALLKKFVTKL